MILVTLVTGFLSWSQGSSQAPREGNWVRSEADEVKPQTLGSHEGAKACYHKYKVYDNARYPEYCRFIVEKKCGLIYLDLKRGSLLLEHLKTVIIFVHVCVC